MVRFIGKTQNGLIQLREAGTGTIWLTVDRRKTTRKAGEVTKVYHINPDGTLAR